MTETTSSDALKNLVIFIIKLAVLGLVLAFAFYYFVEWPRLSALAPPLNYKFFN